MQGPEVLLSEEQIGKRVAEMAGQIAAGNQGRTLHVVAILDNGFMFMCDLVRHLKGPVVCQFIKAETHDIVENGKERRHILYTPGLDVEGKDILLVDAILQTGVTLDHLIHQFLVKKARSVRTAVLVDRPEERRVGLQPDFSGFEIQGQNRFLVGYGLGHQDLYRNLPYIGELAGQAKSAPGSKQE